jgi:hypothetical protein
MRYAPFSVSLVHGHILLPSFADLYRTVAIDGVTWMHEAARVVTNKPFRIIALGYFHRV